jgi:hypothetical protein
MQRLEKIPGVEYMSRAGRNAMKLFINEPRDQLLPIITTFNEWKIPFEEISIESADFFDYFQVKPWKDQKVGGAAV